MSLDVITSVGLEVYNLGDYQEKTKLTNIHELVDDVASQTTQLSKNRSLVQTI